MDGKVIKLQVINMIFKINKNNVELLFMDLFN